MINFFGMVHQCGGCGPELLGAVELLRTREIPVRCIVPIDDPIVNSPAADYLRQIGCLVANYEPGMFARCEVLMTFGEDVCFEYMRKYSDRPKHVVWSSCMSHVIEKEIEAHNDGLIDEFFFQTKENGDAVGPQIVAKCNGKPVAYRNGYRPFVNANSAWMPLTITEKSKEVFTVFKAVRDDAEKWDEYTWRIFSGIVWPAGKKVEVEVAGWGDNARFKVGDPTDPTSKWNGELNVILHPHIYEPQIMSDLYKKAHVLLHYYPFVESYGLAVTQAMLAGCVPVCVNAQGFQQQIIHEKNGFLCDTPEEAIFYASLLAFSEPMREKMGKAARAHVINHGSGNPHEAMKWWDDIIKRSGFLKETCVKATQPTP